LKQPSLSLKEMPQWRALEEHHATTKNQHMRELFASDNNRFDQFSIKLDDILFDYSKNRVTQETIELLVNLAEACDLPGQIASMFKAEKINSTEDRAVLHTALRHRSATPLLLDGEDVHQQVNAEIERTYQLADRVRNGDWLGYDGQAITDVVNIGIGGSYLGPQMVTEALKPFVKKGLSFHFVANLDENQIDDTLSQLNPATTLFIICSKTFTTQETMFNANTARDWFLSHNSDEAQLEKHFVAVSTNINAAKKFGIDSTNIFSMWDWVGGRYSLWSAIGLSVMIAIGKQQFDELLKGANRIDQHFRTTPLEKNIPALMGLLGVWYNNFYDAQTVAILPYSQHLHRFPAYLQQADMESNGKSVCIDGNKLAYSSGPVLFGELGNPGQHAFYQLLHQGTKLVPIDVIATTKNISGESKHQDALISNVFAQTEALMKGKTESEVKSELTASGLSDAEIEKLLPHKVFSGNRPSNTLLLKQLNPSNLGALIALYEHKIFTQGVIWKINSFDQWGVELGKQLAKSILNELEPNSDPSKVATRDSSTTGLMAHYISHRN
jgi:glucose-6-phosphate isomerase